MRAVIVAALIAVLPGAAGAQEAGAATSDDPIAIAVERVRADFNARLVDYDQRMKSIEARLDALEPAQVPEPTRPAGPAAAARPLAPGEEDMAAPPAN